MRKGEVFLFGRLAGVISEDSDGIFRFAYDVAYLASENPLPVSQTMPLTTETYESDRLFPFFDGLIPEGWLLDIAEKSWKLDSRDRMGLLLSCCRKCIGADRMTLVGFDGNYILKLPSGMYPELPEAEHFAMMLARDCGIETADFGLVRLANGALAYVTRRMDREDGVKHMEDMCQLTDRRTERKYFGSYEQIA